MESILEHYEYRLFDHCFQAERAPRLACSIRGRRYLQTSKTKMRSRNTITLGTCSITYPASILCDSSCLLHTQGGQVHKMQHGMR